MQQRNSHFIAGERERERERCTHSDGWFAVDIEVLSIGGKLPQVVVEKGKWRFKTDHLLLKRKERENEQKYIHCL